MEKPSKPDQKSFLKTFNFLKSPKSSPSSEPILRNSRPDHFDFNQSRTRNLLSEKASKKERFMQSPGKNLIVRNRNDKIYDFEELQDIVPKWMLDRADFKEFYIKSALAENVDLGKVVSLPVEMRDNFEKDVLFKWISSLEYFLRTPKNIVRELCERISCRYAKKDEKIIAKGSKADSMYIIYKGCVGIFVDELRVASNKQGDVFGDIALDTNSTRTADVISESDSLTLFSISDVDYKNILFNYKNSEKQKYCRFLSFIHFFSSWSYNKIQQFSSSLVKVCFKSGDTIYDFQEESQVFYIIKSGKIELQTIIEIEQSNRWPVNFREWKTRKVITRYIYPIKQLEKNHFFGQYEFIKKSKRQTKAYALEDTVCLSINRNDFETFVKDNDLLALEKMNENYMPTQQDMEKIMKSNIKAAKINQEILMDAMKIRFLPVDKDCLHDIRSKKLQNWIKSIEKRNKTEANKIGKRVVRRFLKFEATGEEFKDSLPQLPKISKDDLIAFRSKSGVVSPVSQAKSDRTEFTHTFKTNRALSLLQSKNSPIPSILKLFTP